MLVYLVRHGEAVGEKEDPSRPLSSRGERDVGRLASLVARQFILMPGSIYHSPKIRAAQTASIIGSSLHRPTVPEGREGLLPMDDPGIWAQRLEASDMDVMLVGHLPHLSRLASLLLLSDSEREVLDMTPGKMVCLEKTGAWRVKWMISPDVLKIS